MPKSETATDSFVGKIVTSLSGETVEESNAETYPRPTSLSVRNVNGAVSIEGTDRDDVEVRWTKRGPSESALERVSIEATVDDGEELLIAVDDPDPDRTAVDLDIAVPRRLALKTVTSANGTIDVRGTAGDAELETKNGRITVADHEGYVDARTKNGAVNTTDVTGIDRVEATNGKVTADVRSIRTDAAIETTAGEIDVRIGSIDADVVLKTNVGSIDAPLLETNTTALGLSVVEETVGNGGQTLRIANSVGSITLRSMDSPE